MSLSPAFLDELRARTSLSALIGATLALKRAGREHKACCPFHAEQTPSFTINDEKGFAHCFGCAWHGDAIRWLTDARGLGFIDAVTELAAAAGMEMPARTPEAARAEDARAAMRPALDDAQGWFRAQLARTPVARDFLAKRGIDDDAAAEYGLGWAPASGLTAALARHDDDALIAVGLLRASDVAVRPPYGFFRERLTIPVRDARGRMAGFAARATDGRDPKYINSPDTALFDKGRLLFNIDRAAPLARAQRRMTIVEGQFDAIALDRLGIPAAAPMGSALTEKQMMLAWRLAWRPVLMFDGDLAGARAATRACVRALPGIGPGAALAVALCPPGEDPDTLAAQGADAVEAVLAGALAMADYLWASAQGDADAGSPEGRAAWWQQLDDWARAIAHDETRAQYLAEWRARFDAATILPQDAPGLEIVATAAPGAEAPPPLTETDAERRLIQTVLRAEALIAERDTINADLRQLFGMAKLLGYDTQAIRACVRARAEDPAAREDREAQTALYRRVLGIRGPMTEAMLPSVIDARPPRAITGQAKRVNRAMALIAAGAAADPA